MDDYLPYLLDVRQDTHRALIAQDANGSPNRGEDMRLISSQHDSLLAFSKWWTAREGIGKLEPDQLQLGRYTD